MMVATVTPMPKPAATRASVTNVSRCNSPLRARSTKVAKITEGGGARRPLAQPMRTTNSHPTASVTGNIRPSAGHAKRDQRLLAFGCAGGASLAVLWAATVMATRDMGPAAKSMRQKQASHRDVAVVDQIFKRLLHVDIGLDDAGLLQCQARLQDGVALLRSDLVEGQFGALLALDVNYRVRQLGGIDKGLLLVVIVTETVFARLLVDRDHALGQVRIGFEEVFG